MLRLLNQMMTGGLGQIVCQTSKEDCLSSFVTKAVDLSSLKMLAQPLLGLPYLVVGVDHDAFVELESGVLSDPVGVEKAQTSTAATNTLLQ